MRMRPRINSFPYGFWLELHIQPQHGTAYSNQWNEPHNELKRKLNLVDWLNGLWHDDDGDDEDGERWRWRWALWWRWTSGRVLGQILMVEAMENPWRWGMESVWGKIGKILMEIFSFPGKITVLPSHHKIMVIPIGSTSKKSQIAPHTHPVQLNQSMTQCSFWCSSVHLQTS